MHMHWLYFWVGFVVASAVVKFITAGVHVVSGWWSDRRYVRRAKPREENA